MSVNYSYFLQITSLYDFELFYEELPTAGRNILCEHLLLMEPISSVNHRQALLISAHICAIQTSDRGDKQAFFSA